MSKYGQYTGKERDSESGLDYFGARYYGNGFARMTSPDDFLKDSHVAEPQSWNKYAYARNNPLRYIDPSGGKATVSTSCSNDDTGHTTCNVNIRASIAIYGINRFSSQQLDSAASSIKSTIESAWTGKFEDKEDDVTYNVKTSVNVTVAGSKGSAEGTGADNVIGLVGGPVRPDSDSVTNSRVRLGIFSGDGSGGVAALSGPDTGVWNFFGLSMAGHEFGHLLGVDDHPKENILMNGNQLNDPTLPRSATDRDYSLGIREAVRSVNLIKMIGYDPLTMRGGPYSGTQTIQAPYSGWWK